jgi:single-strand DNA-binding protein
MASLARIVVIGYVGKDPEQKAVGDSTVVNFSVAVSDGKKNSEHSTWFRCAAWGNRGEPVMKFVHKGSLVAVAGRLSTREYEKDGRTFVNIEIDADNVVFLDKKEAASGGGGTRPPQSPEDGAPGDEDIPF